MLSESTTHRVSGPGGRGDTMSEREIQRDTEDVEGNVIKATGKAIPTSANPGRALKAGR